jgi:hypothetical protein
MTKVSLFVELKAKSGKEEIVAKFLAGAQRLVEAEPGTVVPGHHVPSRCRIDQ